MTLCIFPFPATNNIDVVAVLTSEVDATVARLIQYLNFVIQRHRSTFIALVYESQNNFGAELTLLRH